MIARPKKNQINNIEKGIIPKENNPITTTEQIENTTCKVFKNDGKGK